MTDERTSDPIDSDDETDAQRKAIARRLAEILDTGTSRPPDDDEGAEGAEGPDRPRGRLRLDKTGALADRPKLTPKKPYARTGRDSPGPETEESSGAVEVPRKAAVPAPLSSLRPPELAPDHHASSEEEVPVAGGTFLYGEEVEEAEVPAFRIDRLPVTHAAYAEFVRATGHRPPLYWPDGRMPEELADHPVVGIDYFDALAYARWKGKDLPYEDEWERAARGKDGRTYPWGSEPELGEANTARLGVRMTVPIGWYEMNVSPDGVGDMVGNVWEITHSPAQGGGIVVRGGSWYDFVLYAKNWFRFASRTDARNGTIGFRCVRRDRARTDAKREVDEARADAEIAARRGPQPMPETGAFSADRRDLVPDYRRLNLMLKEREEEAESAARSHGPGPVAIPKKPAVRATPPPPIARSPYPSARDRLRPETRRPTPPPPPAATSESVASPPPVPPAPPRDASSKPAAPSSPEAAEPKAGKRAGRKRAEKKARKRQEHQAAGAAASTQAASGASKTSKTSKEPQKPAKPQPVAAALSEDGNEKSPALDRAGIEHAADMAAKSAVATAEDEPRRPEAGTPFLYWAILGGALVLVCVFLALMLSGVIGGDDEPRDEYATQGPLRTPDGEPPLSVATPSPERLPVGPATDDRDTAPPYFIDGWREGWDAELNEGVWLVVFVNGQRADDALTMRTASNLHRRMRDTGASVLLVMPREIFCGAEGRLMSGTECKAILRTLHGSYDLNVLQDEPDGTAFGSKLRSRYRVTDPIAAMVLVDGRPEHRLSPWEGGFHLEELEPLAYRATRIRPVVEGRDE